MLQERMVINECYILQKRIGEDSYTEHWIATAIFSATRFLLRFIKNNDNIAGCLDELRSEAMRCYRVRGNFISDFVEVEFFKERLFISSEYHDEKTLLSILEKKKDWRLEQICLYIMTLARGLDAFHSQGIFYGNLNAENVLVDKAGGVLHSIKIQKPSLLSLLPSLSNNEVYRFESYAYISPECKSGKKLGKESDIYSLGIHLVRFFTGRLPFSSSADALESGSAALRYTTNALLRRGVPEGLIRITLRSLLPDPSRRYNSCFDMINDLRQFMESSEIKTIETENYFKSLDAIQENEEKNSILYPVNTFTDQATVDRLEKQELDIIEEEQQWSIDDYIRNGLKSLNGEKGMERIVTARLPEKMDALLTANGLTPGGGSSSDSAALSNTSTTYGVSLEKTMGSQTAMTQVVNQLQINGETLKRNVNWNYLRVRMQDVRGIIDLSAKRAHKGKGSFRYIQEPIGDSLNAELFSSLERLKSDCLYVNLGSCKRFGTATTADFLKMLRQGISRSLSEESKNAIAYVSRLVSKQDTFGVFSSAPLGSVLYRTDSKEVNASVLKTAECQQSILNSLAVLGRKKRPLVLVIRGGESIHKDLHKLFTVIANGIHDVPVCILVFFEHKQFDSWHALSAVPDTNLGEKI